MRFVPVLALIFAAILSMGPAARADTQHHKSADPTSCVLGEGNAVLKVDPENGSVHVLINGKEQLRIDANGLHVLGDITYSGAFTDVGPANAIPAKKSEGDAP